MPRRPSLEPAATGSGLLPAFAEPHPFAGFLRTIGRGATLGRPLDEAEAEQAMAMILDGAVEPVQLGAFLLVLRYRTETPAELAGFVRAARSRIKAARRPRGRPGLAVLRRPTQAAALLPVGGPGPGGERRPRADARHRRRGPATTRAGLAALGLPVAGSPAQAVEDLVTRNFAYLPLEVLCPELERLFSLRPLLGLRSPANSLARELNPFAAPHQIQGVFHPTYLPLHQETAQRLAQPRAVIFKGGGGEGQRNPDKPCRAVAVVDGVAQEEIWPAFDSGSALALAQRSAGAGPACRALAWRLGRPTGRSRRSPARSPWS